MPLFQDNALQLSLKEMEISCCPSSVKQNTKNFCRMLPTAQEYNADRNDFPKYDCGFLIP
jgi:hypothetical protein